MKKFSLFLATLFLIASPVFTHAADEGTPPTLPDEGTPPTSGGTSFNIKISNPLAGDVRSIPDLITKIINDIILPIGGVVAVLMIMWAGFLYVTSQGSPERVKKAHSAFFNASIGAAILLGAYLIAQVVDNTIKAIQ